MFLKSTLIDSFNKGDREAWNQVFAALHPKIYQTSFRIVKNEQVAKDIMIESFMKCHRPKEPSKSIKSIEELTGFLVTVAKNASYDFLRRQQTRKEPEKELPQAIPDHNEEKESTESDNAYMELAEKARALLGTLTPQREKILRMIYLEGETMASTAEKLGISMRTVYNHVYEALEELALQMGIERKGKRKPK